eukprot:GFYU01020541.1.p1 GENE.GFYU01020541.1~~GFYU01020541.1.p1  ORF type:complete len:266 (-),score=81.12 GFYU01020541.1:154-951(-)
MLDILPPIMADRARELCAKLERYEKMSPADLTTVLYQVTLLFTSTDSFEEVVELASKFRNRKHVIQAAIEFLVSGSRMAYLALRTLDFLSYDLPCRQDIVTMGVVPVLVGILKHSAKAQERDYELIRESVLLLSSLTHTPAAVRELGRMGGAKVLVTLMRPENVDIRHELLQLLEKMLMNKRARLDILESNLQPLLWEMITHDNVPEEDINLCKMLAKELNLWEKTIFDKVCTTPRCNVCPKKPGDAIIIRKKSSYVRPTMPGMR